MAQNDLSRPAVKRLLWIDIAKGIGILWVVFFHFVTNYIDTDSNPNLPSPTSGHFIQTIAGSSGFDSLSHVIETFWRWIWYSVSLVGFHAVGLFVLLGGWSLAASTWKKSEQGPVIWSHWYKQRFVRLYPMYWAAHLLLLLLPFTWLEPIDGRIFISLSGLRWINLESNFSYGNAAWWYFAMLIQLYAIFPVLFLIMRRIGLSAFLMVGISLGLVTRYLLLVEWQSHGFWLMGANCLSRIPEFVVGMVLGILHLQQRERVERMLLSPGALCLGLCMYYWLALVHGQAMRYVFADLYIALSCSLVILGLSGFFQRSEFLSRWVGLVGTYSFGLYLTHQPLVTWLGQRMQKLSTYQFLGVSAVVLFVLSGFGIWMERLVNGLTDRVLGKGK
jgi:peptidoglycan/LPS O-acetylase OafA/YrhL